MSLYRFIGILAVSISPLLAAAPAHAVCTPDVKSGVVCLDATDDRCSTLGTTTLDGDQQNLIACMGTTAGSNCSSGQCRWKSMTSSPVGDRPKITPITAAACSFTNSTKNTDASYSCAIPAKATHLKITAKCASIGINGDSRAKAYFTPPSEPFTITDPEVICAEHSASGETSQDSAYHLVPVPKNVSTITILTEKTGNVEERKIVVSIMPLIIE